MIKGFCSSRPEGWKRNEWEMGAVHRSRIPAGAGLVCGVSLDRRAEIPRTPFVKSWHRCWRRCSQNLSRHCLQPQTAASLWTVTAPGQAVGLVNVCNLLVQWQIWVPQLGVFFFEEIFHSQRSTSRCSSTSHTSQSNAASVKSLFFLLRLVLPDQWWGTGHGKPRWPQSSQINGAEADGWHEATHPNNLLQCTFLPELLENQLLLVVSVCDGRVWVCWKAV